MNKFTVRGGSLSAAIFASQLALRGASVHMVVSESHGMLVPGWKAASIAGYDFNNGYHALEVGRAPRLGNLLALELGLPFSLDSRPLGIWIRGRLISSDADPRLWPSELYKADVQQASTRKNLSLFELQNLLSDYGRNFFGSLASRYGEAPPIPIEQFLPWFLPNSFTIDSNDEGDVYRNLIRAGLIRGTRLVPRSGLFEQLGTDWKNKLQAIGVKLESDSAAKKLSPATRLPQDDSGQRNFHCSLFELSKNDFESFAEIIVADEITPELSRVSILPGPIPNLLLCESYHTPGATPNPQQWGDRIEDVGRCKAEFLGSELTREMRFSSPKSAGLGFSHVSSADVYEVEFHSQGPINMAKASAIADRAIEEIGAT